MVKAEHGCLLQTDVPTKEYLLMLNSKAHPREKFILRDLDDTHLWVKPDKADFVLHAVTEFNNANVFVAPKFDDGDEEQKKASGGFGKRKAAE